MSSRHTSVSSVARRRTGRRSSVVGAKVRSRKASTCSSTGTNIEESPSSEEGSDSVEESSIDEHRRKDLEWHERKQAAQLKEAMARKIKEKAERAMQLPSALEAGTSDESFNQPRTSGLRGRTAQTWTPVESQLLNRMKPFSELPQELWTQRVQPKPKTVPRPRPEVLEYSQAGEPPSEVPAVDNQQETNAPGIENAIGTNACALENQREHQQGATFDLDDSRENKRKTQAQTYLDSKRQRIQGFEDNNTSSQTANANNVMHSSSTMMTSTPYPNRTAREPSIGMSPVTPNNGTHLSHLIPTQKVKTLARPPVRDQTDVIRRLVRPAQSDAGDPIVQQPENTSQAAVAEPVSDVDEEPQRKTRSTAKLATLPPKTKEKSATPLPAKHKKSRILSSEKQVGVDQDQQRLLPMQTEPLSQLQSVPSNQAVNQQDPEMIINDIFESSVLPSHQDQNEVNEDDEQPGLSSSPERHNSMHPSFMLASPHTAAEPSPYFRKTRATSKAAPKSKKKPAPPPAVIQEKRAQRPKGDPRMQQPENTSHHEAAVVKTVSDVDEEPQHKTRSTAILATLPLKTKKKSATPLPAKHKKSRILPPESSDDEQSDVEEEEQLEEPQAGYSGSQLSGSSTRSRQSHRQSTLAQTPTPVESQLLSRMKPFSELPQELWTQRVQPKPKTVPRPPPEVLEYSQAGEPPSEVPAVDNQQETNAPEIENAIGTNACALENQREHQQGATFDLDDSRANKRKTQAQTYLDSKRQRIQGFEDNNTSSQTANANMQQPENISHHEAPASSRPMEHADKSLVQHQKAAPSPKPTEPPERTPGIEHDTQLETEKEPARQTRAASRAGPKSKKKPAPPTAVIHEKRAQRSKGDPIIQKPESTSHHEAPASSRPMEHPDESLGQHQKAAPSPKPTEPPERTPGIEHDTQLETEKEPAHQTRAASRAGPKSKKKPAPPPAVIQEKRALRSKGDPIIQQPESTSHHEAPASSRPMEHADKSLVQHEKAAPSPKPTEPPERTPGIEHDTQLETEKEPARQTRAASRAGPKSKKKPVPPTAVIQEKRAQSDAGDPIIQQPENTSQAAVAEPVSDVDEEPQRKTRSTAKLATLPSKTKKKSATPLPDKQKKSRILPPESSDDEQSDVEEEEQLEEPQAGYSGSQLSGSSTRSRQSHRRSTLAIARSSSTTSIKPSAKTKKTAPPQEKTRYVGNDVFGNYQMLSKQDFLKLLNDERPDHGLDEQQQKLLSIKVNHFLEDFFTQECEETEQPFGFVPFSNLKKVMVDQCLLEEDATGDDLLEEMKQNFSKADWKRSERVLYPSRYTRTGNNKDFLYE